MPKTGSEINHTSITDHRVPRHGESPARPPAPGAWPRPGQTPLVHFHRDLVAPGDEEVARDLGLALIAITDSQPPQNIARQLADTALPLLDAASARDPKDMPVLAARGSALWLLGRLPDALAAYEASLSQKPDEETTLFQAATLATRLAQRDRARAYWERVVWVNPWRWQYHQQRAAFLAQEQTWDAAANECRESLRLNPAQLGTRRLLVLCYLRQGERRRAEEEFNAFLGLSPAEQQAGLRRWFDQQAR
jgi:tetratricopeptide (TPR) repeat protein